MSAEQLDTLKKAALQLVAMIAEIQRSSSVPKEEEEDCGGRSVLSVAFPAPVPVSVTDSSPRQRRKQVAKQVASISVEQQQQQHQEGDAESHLTHHQTRASLRHVTVADTGSTISLSTSTAQADARSQASVSYARADTASSWTESASRSSRMQ